MQSKCIAAALQLIALTIAAPATAQDYGPFFKPDSMTDRPVGDPNEVMVLGTPHLSQYRDTLDPAMVDPLVDRLVAWRPTAVATEDSSGLLCYTMRRHSSRHAEAVEAYCYDPAAANAATGLDVIAANDAAEAMLADWPESPTPALRRRLAAFYLAAGEPASALVQWLRLPKPERHAEDILTAELAEQLDKRMKRINETDLVAARVAALAGLERVWGVDDQSTDLGPLADPDGYGKALMTAWDNPATAARSRQAEQLAEGLAQPDGLMAIYRAYNQPKYAKLAYESDWGAALADPSLQGFGRRYVSYWETRNLRMVANIRQVLGRTPGTRMLAIVGASHKGYYEAYLAQMRDVELVDVLPVLGEPEASAGPRD